MDRVAGPDGTSDVESRAMRSEQIAAGLLVGLLVAAGSAAAKSGKSAPEWGPREAEHLLNRAAFGARPGEVARAVERGREATVEALIEGAYTDPFFYEPPPRPTREEMAAMDEDARRRARNEYRRRDRQLLASFAGWWVEEMIDGRDPLRERMTLFWHGYFTSSFRDVRDGVAMIEQNELLREHARGRFGDLLRAIVRDPAMLEYLDNNRNRKQRPNENFARELMELFTLGEGNYTERDVKEAARALTGWVERPGIEPRMVRRLHDRGRKTILGRTGNFDADDLVDILLEQPACARWVTGKLMAYFEGRAPGEERLQGYAELLLASGYRIDRFLEQLLNDPEFYSEEVMGQRIAGPVEYLVGTARRLGVDPPGELLWLAAGQLGQRLLDPPNVKGWDGGRSWITTSTYLQRGNVAGMMLGVVSPRDVVAEDPALTLDSSMDDPAMEPVMEGAMEGEPRGNRPGPGAARTGMQPRRPSMTPEMIRMNRMIGRGYRPGIHLTARCRRAGATLDTQVVDVLAEELLAVPLTPEGRITLQGFLQREREALGAPDGGLFEGEHAVATEDLLRRLAHVTLSLPEAHLN
jgi:uncharacterized protein (DUF1800 family)